MKYNYCFFFPFEIFDYKTKAACLSMINQEIKPSNIYVSSSKKNELKKIYKFFLIYKFTNVKVFLSKRKYIPEKLNLMLKHCTEEYILRMDSDDICFKDRASKQINCLNKNGTDICFSSYISIQEGKVNKNLSNSNINSILLKLPFKNMIVHPTIAIRKSMLLKFKGYGEFQRSQDLDLWLRIYNEEQNCKWSFIKDPTIFYSISNLSDINVALKSSENGLRIVIHNFLKYKTFLLSISLIYKLLIYMFRLSWMAFLNKSKQ